MRRDFFGFLKVIPIWVALMSGVFSIVREVANLYPATQTALWGKNVFWACVWVTFVIASLTAWFLKHRELVAEREKNTKPEITGEIEEVHDVWALPGGAQPNPLEYFFTVKARISNVRPVPTTVRFELWLEAPYANCKALRSSLSGLLHRHDQHATGSMSRESIMHTITEAMPDLETLGRTPLTIGDEREGWLRFMLPKANAPIRKDVHSLRLVIKDVYGGEHTIRSPRSEWQHSGEIITQFALDLENRRIRDAGRGL